MTDTAPGAGSAGTGSPGGSGSSGMTPAQARAAAAIEQALAGLGLVPERPEPGSYLVRLPGQRKLASGGWGAFSSRMRRSGSVTSKSCGAIAGWGASSTDPTTALGR